MDIPYLGYVEVKIQITGINSFEQDALMLVSHTTAYYIKWVPFQVGSRIIDWVVKNIMDEELRLLSQSWKLAMWALSYLNHQRLGIKNLILVKLKEMYL